MNLLLMLTIQTANILGIFTDPFEFAGDYGSQINPIREKVFERVVSKEALARNLTDAEIKNFLGYVSEQEINYYRDDLVQKAILEDKNHGPSLLELVTPELLEEIEKKQIELELGHSDFEAIAQFIQRHQDQKFFYFLRNNPPELLHLDKVLRDKAAREGKIFDLPILGSMKVLDSTNLKKNLLEAVFTAETLALTKSPEMLKGKLENQELEVFCSPLGQVFFYWMYQALNLHLISDMVDPVNQVKENFALTLGDPYIRANALKDKLIASDTSVLFTQESDALTPQLLVEDGLFLSIESQNSRDGTFVLLRSDVWESEYQVIPLEGYEGFNAGRMNLILAKRKNSNEQFLLASCHGHSIRSEDGRLQIRLIMEKFHELSDGNLQLLIGIDANTKTEVDVELFQQQLDQLGLVSTRVGPTTIKKRVVTAQHAKAGKLAIDEEDYLITIKLENGGKFQFEGMTVGFKEGIVDITQPLPNRENLSDHYPVGASLKQL